MAAGSRHLGGGDRCGPRHADRGDETEVEAKPEEEEGVELRGAAAAAAQQHGGGLVLIPDHSVALSTQLYVNIQNIREARMKEMNEMNT